MLNHIERHLELLWHLEDHAGHDPDGREQLELVVREGLHLLGRLELRHSIEILVLARQAQPLAEAAARCRELFTTVQMHFREAEAPPSLWSLGAAYFLLLVGLAQSNVRKLYLKLCSFRCNSAHQRFTN